MTRFTLTREFMIPSGARPVDCTGTDAAVYVYETAGRLCAIGFHGKAQRPDFNFSYRSEEGRDAAVARFVGARKAVAEDKAKRIATRQAKGRGLDVGDVLVSSWGYDQTNIDYYEVTALVGKRMVELRRIAAQTVETAFMQGKSVPMKGNYIGAAMRKVAVDGHVRVRSCASASKMEPVKIAGCEIFEASHWTAYA